MADEIRPITAVQGQGASPLLASAMSELHRQIADLPPDAKGSIMGAVDVHGNAKVVLVGNAGHGWTYIVTGARYDGKLEGYAGVSKVF